MVPATGCQHDQYRHYRQQPPIIRRRAFAQPDTVFPDRFGSASNASGNRQRVKYGTVSTSGHAASGLLPSRYRRAADCIKCHPFGRVAEGGEIYTAQHDIHIFAVQQAAQQNRQNVMTPLHLADKAKQGAAIMVLCEHRIRQSIVELFTPCLPEGFQLHTPVVVFMGVAGKGNAENSIPALFIQRGNSAANRSVNPVGSKTPHRPVTGSEDADVHPVNDCAKVAQRCSRRCLSAVSRSGRSNVRIRPLSG